jgi:hypothetical protein
VDPEVEPEMTERQLRSRSPLRWKVGQYGRLWWPSAVALGENI